VAITADTLRLVAELRATLAAITDARTRVTVGAWVRGWDTIAAEVHAGITDLLTQVDHGRWPSRAAVLRTTRLIRVLDLARIQLEHLATQVDTGARADAAAAAHRAAGSQGRLVASQLPAGTTPAQVAARYGSFDTAMLDAIVARTGEQITALTRPLSQLAYEAMLRTLIRGVAVGDNPRTTAALMLRRVEGQFNGGLTRALVIARTETLDAARTASRATQLAQADVLAGWQWHSARDARTCPSCWAQDGGIHPLDQPGPLDHQQGRCTRLPVVRSWRDLGIAAPEPPSVLQPAEQVFAALPEDDQLAVMGPARLAALQSGQASWSDLSQRRRTHGWRDSYAPTPVRALAARPAA
jgi:hypothetical protein